MEKRKAEIKSMLPNLVKEIEEAEEGENKVSINSVRSNTEEAERYASDVVPDVIYYLKKCKTDKEATEIIDYMERRGEISQTYAKKLRMQLLQKGLKSFRQLK